MKETYKVKRPDKITWGDPWYMKEFSGEKLQSLIVDFEPPKYCDARVVLEEKPMKDYPDVLYPLRYLFLYVAETQTSYSAYKFLSYALVPDR